MHQAESAKDCQDKCRNEDECKAFTYFHENGHCWLKTSAENWRIHKGAISGPKSCQSAYKVLNNINLSGLEIEP